MKIKDLEKEDIKSCFKERDKDSNKGDFGYIALVGGSLPYSGAVRLAAMANCAMRAGAGVVSVAVPKSIAYLVAENILESTVYPLSEKDGYIRFEENEFEGLLKRYRVIAIGMGIGNTEESYKCVEYLVENYEGILLIDADGLNVLSRMDREAVRSSKARIVLTPHIKEFARLARMDAGDVSCGDKAELSSMLAKELGCIVLLKGPVTYVSDGDTVYLSQSGCPGMATAGSGDVLSGILSAVLACNEGDILLATAAGAYLNGLAGEIAQRENGQISMIASDTVRAVRDAVMEITK
jgi:NAD(P)H-hydrate epimerase